MTILQNIPAGLDAIIKTFGSLDDPDFERVNIIPFTLPYPLLYGVHTVEKSRAHKKAAPNFIGALRTLQEKKLDKFVKSYGGIHARRGIRGYTSHPSTHSWGIAGDFEPLKYPLGSLKRMPAEVISVFESFGFFYGGNFSGRRDPQHFQLATHY